MSRILTKFMSPSQFATLNSLVSSSEESEHFIQVGKRLIETLNTMPRTCEQDGMGDEAVVYLHYFIGGCDWYITERDVEDRQLQAFGWADLGYGGELGYINIEEITQAGAELDFHFKPRALGEITRKKYGQRPVC